MKRNDLEMENIKTSVLSDLGLGYDHYVDNSDISPLWKECDTVEEFYDKLVEYLKN